MKKFLLIAVIISAIFLFSGCGQEMDVTVYNAVPLWGAQWIAINGHTEHHDQWFWPYDYARKYDECDNSNSVTFKGKENENLNVCANGQIYEIDAGGNTSLADFSVPVASQLLYGGFLETAHWYAEVNLTSVIIYKK